jgi:hypothetical protein
MVYWSHSKRNCGNIGVLALLLVFGPHDAYIVFLFFAFLFAIYGSHLAFRVLKFCGLSIYDLLSALHHKHGSGGIHVPR